MAHRRIPLLALKSFCNGRLIIVLATMAMSLRPNCHVLAVNKAQGRTLKGRPVSLIFLSIVVMTMIASPIQNKTKKPLKSRYSLFGSKCDTRAEYSTVGKSRCFCCARICFRADDIDCTEGGASRGSGVDLPLGDNQRASSNRPGKVSCLEGPEIGTSVYPFDLSGLS